MEDHTILFNNLYSQGQANINAWSKVSTQFNVIIQIQCHFVSKHHPFEPLKLTELAFIGGLSRYHLGNFHIQFVDAIHIVWPNVGFKFSLDLINFLPKPFFSSLISLSAVFDYGVNGSVCLKWPLVCCWTHQVSFLWHCHILLQMAPHPTEREGKILHGLHFSASLEKSVTNQHHCLS